MALPHEPGNTVALLEFRHIRTDLVDDAGRVCSEDNRPDLDVVIVVLDIPVHRVDGHGAFLNNYSVRPGIGRFGGTNIR